MAGGDDSKTPELTPEQRLDQELAFRYDLSDAVGMFVVPPPNAVDELGNIIWGEYGLGMVGSEAAFGELRAFLVKEVESTTNDYPKLPAFERKATAHRYEQPPAAQGIAEIALLFWEHGLPLLGNLLTIYEIGKFLAKMSQKASNWYERKNRQITELNTPYYEAGESGPHKFVQPNIYFTQNAIGALIVAELVDRVGFQDDLAIDIQARGFEGYSTPDHPNSHMTYLLRVQYASQQFGYVVDARGEVIEHFQVGTDEFLSLPVPNLLNGGLEEYARKPSGQKVRLRSS